MGAVSTSTATTSFAAPTITLALATAITTATLVVPTTAMVAAGSEHLALAPGTSEREHLAPAPRASERALHVGRVEYRRDGSQFHRLADRVRHLQDQQRHQIAISQRAGQDRDHGVASAHRHQPLGSRDVYGTLDFPLRDQVFRPLHKVQGGINHYDKGQSGYDFGQIRARVSHSSRAFAPNTCVPMAAANSSPINTMATARSRRTSIS